MNKTLNTISACGDLDMAVAKALGWRFQVLPDGSWQAILPNGFINAGFDSPEDALHAIFNPSTDWADGGPIVEQEHISLHFYTGHWSAVARNSEGNTVNDEHRLPVMAVGKTPLEAAMRAFLILRG
jgi:hypothetical protein